MIKEKLYSLIGFFVAIPFIIAYLIAGEDANEEYANIQNEDIGED